MPIFLGAAIGGFLGFLLRPSVPLVGPLPFETVITRGANLTGLDSLLRGRNIVQLHARGSSGRCACWLGGQAAIE